MSKLRISDLQSLKIHECEQLACARSKIYAYQTLVYPILSNSSVSVRLLLPSFGA